MQVRKTTAERQMLIDRRQYTERLEQQIQQQTVALRHAHEETIHRLVAASACRDVETSMHILRTGLLAEALARATGWPPAEVERIRFAAPMHDVGKIGIPDAILRKPSKLTRRRVRDHEVAHDDRRQYAGRVGHRCCRWHSRSLDASRALERRRLSFGTGWGGDTGSGADHGHRRRLRFAHARARYRPALSEKAALEIMRHGDGKDFDPVLLAIFFQNLPLIRSITAKYPDEPNENAEFGLNRFPGEFAALAEPVLAGHSC